LRLTLANLRKELLGSWRVFILKDGILQQILMLFTSVSTIMVLVLPPDTNTALYARNTLFPVKKGLLNFLLRPQKEGVGLLIVAIAAITNTMKKEEFRAALLLAVVPVVPVAVVAVVAVVLAVGEEVEEVVVAK
jgi:hypothetical protein